VKDNKSIFWWAGNLTAMTGWLEAWGFTLGKILFSKNQLVLYFYPLENNQSVL
jgi:hypothetical protein